MKISTSLALFSGLATAIPQADKPSGSAVQANAPWNLRAISHQSPRRLPGVTLLRRLKYYYDEKSGQDTYAYVLDTGIRISHKEFEGRAKNFWTAIKTADNEDDFDDKDGHGTHVAGTIASKTYGVAKKAQVLSVKVLDQEGKGLTSQAINGFNMAVKDILTNDRRNKAVINYSGGTEFSQAWNTAIDRASKTAGGGVVTVVAAGNEAQPVNDVSPASANGALAVGAIDPDWKFASYSNFGSKIRILAPGSDVVSLSSKSDSATATLSGTSMACPHVAGLVLNAMSVFGKTTNTVRYLLETTATQGKVTGDLRGSPNLLANNHNNQQHSCKAGDDAC